MQEDYDARFYETAYDEDGNPYTVLRRQISKSETGTWTTYDTSYGHCGLCGSLSCNGGCFK
jgi:hypothetical protein